MCLSVAFFFFFSLSATLTICSLIDLFYRRANILCTATCDAVPLRYLLLSML